MTLSCHRWWHWGRIWRFSEGFADIMCRRCGELLQRQDFRPGDYWPEAH